MARKRKTKESRVGAKKSIAAVDILKSIFVSGRGEIDGGDSSKSKDLIPHVGDTTSSENTYKVDCRDSSKSEDLVPQVPDPLLTAEQELQTEMDKCANQQLSQDIMPLDIQPIDDDEYCEDIIEEYTILGYKCELCTMDLSEHISEEYYDDEDMLPRKLPDISVLPCGHTFHSDCLDSVTPEDLSSDYQCCYEILSSLCNFQR